MARPVKEDITRNQMTTETVDGKQNWHDMIRVGTIQSVHAYW